MKVALYYPWIYLPGGPERTLVQLLARSRHDWTLLTNHYDRDASFPELRSLKVVELPRVSVKRALGPVARAAARIAFQKLPLEGHDALVIGCDGLGDLSLLCNAELPTVCLCFTPLRAAFDPPYQQGYLERNNLRFLRAPLVHALAAAYRAVDRFMWRRYDRVVAISEEVRARIVRGGLRKREAIDVLYPGVDLQRLQPSAEYRRNFLVAGRIMWTKNIELAIHAFQRFRAERPAGDDFTLTIAGHVDRKSEPYFARLKELAAGDPHIRFLTSLSDDELFAQCRSCYALLYTPFNEDWGLVPIECMALKRPVIGVNRGGPRETIVDGETGFLVDPTPEAFAHAMTRLADDEALHRRLGHDARTRAERFDWKHFAQGLDDLVERLVLQDLPRVEDDEERSLASPSGD